MHPLLCVELAAIQALHNVLVLNLEGLDARLGFFQLNLLLISRKANLAVAVIVKALLLAGLFCICATVFKQLLAVVKDFILLDHLAVLVALKLRKRVCMLSLVARSL